MLEFPLIVVANIALAHTDCESPRLPVFSCEVLLLFPQPSNKYICNVPPEALSRLPEIEFKSGLDRAAAAPCQPLPFPVHVAV